MTAITHNEWQKVNNKRYRGRLTSGFTGNHVDPVPYVALFGDFPRLQTPSGVIYSLVDVPNEDPAFKSKNDFPHARNKSWAKLVDKLRTEPASLGTALAEWSESLEMVTHRASQLYRGYRHLRRGQFRAFLNTFGIGPKRKHRNLIRNSLSQAPSLWLEYSFGWKPAVQDIYDACNSLQQPVPGGSASGSGAEEYSYRFKTGSGVTLHTYHYNGVAHVKQGARFYIDSPNLYALQQLGVANPVSIAWELVPFSFMVDWVFDIGSFLGGFSDLLGLRVIGAYTTFFLKARGGQTYQNPPADQHGVVVRMVRETGLSRPIPNFSFTANVGRSLTRAANAVSLLAQILGK